MRARSGFWGFAKKAALICLGMILFLGILAYSQGAMLVYVREKKSGGIRVFLPLPALLVTETLGFIPSRDVENASRDVRLWLPAVQAASHELQRVPDCVLVEVKSPTEQVLISKQGDDLLINVDDSSETVHVSLPIESLDSIAGTLMREQSPI